MNASAVRRAGVVLAIVLASPLTFAADPSGLNQITFENRTGDEIRYLFLSPGDSQFWGTDVLGASRTLADDQDVSFFIDYPSECNSFDIYAATTSGRAYLVYDHEICDGKAATVRFTRRNLDAEAVKFNYTIVNLKNDTRYEIQYLFFSPGDSNMWGVDQLDTTTTLSPGETLSMLLPLTKDVARYDVRAVDVDDDTYSFAVEIDPTLSEHNYPIEESDRD